MDVATPPGRARSAHALRVHRLLGIPERELFVPARYPRCRSRRIVWVLASLGFSFYLANFSNYSVIYGSIGAAFALLLYFYISAAVLLFGAEVNAAIHHYASDGDIQEEERKTGYGTPDAEGRSREDV